jgi:hypothetical protein
MIFSRFEYGGRKMKRVTRMRGSEVTSDLNGHAQRLSHGPLSKNNNKNPEPHKNQTNKQTQNDVEFQNETKPLHENLTPRIYGQVWDA